MRVCAMPAGPRVGQVLERLLEAVIEDPSLNDPHRLAELAQRMAADGGEGEA
jgi:hypothetical protein